MLCNTFIMVSEVRNLATTAVCKADYYIISLSKQYLSELQEIIIWPGYASEYHIFANKGPNNNCLACIICKYIQTSIFHTYSTYFLTTGTCVILRNLS